MTTTTSEPRAPAAPDLGAIKQRQQGAWSSGDYSIVGTTLVIVSEQLCEAVDLRAGERVLDVATGNGVTALAAARRWGDVTGIDYVPALVERAKERAQADRLAADFRVADAEALPFDDASFDVVLSTFGVMFTPDQPRAARELTRVCRPGGRIGLANWTPDSYVGQMFKLIATYAPPPAGAPSPMQWGVEAKLREFFGDSIRSLEIARRHFDFRYRDPAHFIEVFRAYYGPIHKLYGALEPAKQAALTEDLTALLRRFDRGGDRGLVVPSEYLEVIATRR
ncbi:MAG TPA: class I SAM-dependent methyltransferase [Burkholderiaceae bacterium]|nr:class I SAM-dependent methyltransferase [Burkholderiaceae bacterium]